VLLGRGGGDEVIQYGCQGGQHIGFYLKIEILKRWPKLKIFGARHVTDNIIKQFAAIC